MNELDEGAVSAFAVADDGLTFVNRVASHGAHPAHLSVHPSGRWLLVANYTGGTIAALPIRADGALGEAADVAPHAGSGPHPERQAGPHPHMIVTDPAGEYVLVPDLGVDAVVAYRLDLDSGQLIAEPQAGGKQAPAAGPRHLAFGRAVYVLNELDSTLVAHDYAAGTLRHLQSVSTLPAGFTGSSTTSAVVVSPSGHHVYASNRGHDSIAIFEIDSATGRLTPRGHTLSGGRTPRDFRIDPSGRFLLAANQNSDSLVTFRVDPDNRRARADRPRRRGAAAGVRAVRLVSAERFLEPLGHDRRHHFGIQDQCRVRRRRRPNRRLPGGRPRRAR